MRIFSLLSLIICVALFFGCSGSQPAGGGDNEAPAPAAAAGPQIHGNLAQVMQGILYPASNIIFAAQDENPADVKPAPNPPTSPNLLSSSFGGWLAVENSGLALVEAANLITMPGRKCANGRDVPIESADWKMFVQGLRDAGMATYKAAQSKNQDNIFEATDKVATACQNCHDRYREKPAGEADRCM